MEISILWENKIIKKYEKRERKALKENKKNLKKIKKRIKIPYSWEDLCIGVRGDPFYALYYDCHAGYQVYFDEIFMFKNNPENLAHEIIHKYFYDIIVSPIRKEVNKIRESLRRKSIEVIKIIEEYSKSSLEKLFQKNEKVYFYVLTDKLVRSKWVLPYLSYVAYIPNIKLLKNYYSINETSSFALIPSFLIKDKKFSTRGPITRSYIFSFSLLDKDYLNEDEIDLIFSYNEKEILGFEKVSSPISRTFHYLSKILKGPLIDIDDIFAFLIEGYLKNLRKGVPPESHLRNYVIDAYYNVVNRKKDPMVSEDIKLIKFLFKYIEDEVSKGNKFEEVINDLLLGDYLILLEKIGRIKLPESVRASLT